MIYFYLKDYSHKFTEKKIVWFYAIGSSNHVRLRHPVSNYNMFHSTGSEDAHV